MIQKILGLGKRSRRTTSQSLGRTRPITLRTPLRLLPQTSRDDRSRLQEHSPLQTDNMTPPLMQIAKSHCRRLLGSPMCNQVMMQCSPERLSLRLLRPQLETQFQFLQVDTQSLAQMQVITHSLNPRLQRISLSVP